MVSKISGLSRDEESVSVIALFRNYDLTPVLKLHLGTPQMLILLLNLDWGTHGMAGHERLRRGSI